MIVDDVVSNMASRPKLIRQDGTRDFFASDKPGSPSSVLSSRMNDQDDDKGDHDGDLISLGNDYVVVEVDHGERRLGANDVRGERRSLKSTSEGSPPRGAGTYSIQFKYLTSMTSAQRASFEYAAARLGKMITTRHGAVSIPSSVRCNPVPDEQLPGTIEDLFIFVSVRPLDNVGGVLGQAGPCLMDKNGYPRVGYVEFDVADVERMIKDTTFDAVCVHEIMHIIGIGTLWSGKQLIGGSSSDPRYMGKFGTAALSVIKGTFMGTPAIQDKGGAGTQGSHWRDAAFGDEMMTAYLSASYQPVSALTVESFKDLGYTVDSSTADSFTVSADGYTVPNVPYSENPSQPKWYSFDIDSNFWNSTTIWIVACVCGTALVLLLSCIYTKLRSRRNKPPARPSNPPIPMSSALPRQSTTTAYPLPSAQQYSSGAVPQAVYMPSAAYGGTPRENIPVAYPVVPPPGGGRSAYPTTDVASDQHVSMFMEITGCRDRNTAARYMRAANGNVSVAVDKFMQTNERQMAVV